jgi:hypothetical protein
VPLVLLSPCPSAVLLLFLSMLFFILICNYLETLGFQCLNALGPTFEILSSASIWVGCGSRSAGHVFTRVPNCNELGTQNLVSPTTSQAKAASAIDCHDHCLPGNGCHALPARVSIGVLALGKNPKILKFFIMVQSLSLCLTGVCIV